jgi:hypothetical protein
MKKSLITSSITIILLLSSCLSHNPTTPTSDNVVLQTIFKNHPPPVFSVNEEPPPPGMTFEEFSKYLVYTREDIDINNDGKKEILLSGSTALPNWAFFIIYTSNSNQELRELYYKEAIGIYSAITQFKVTPPYLLVDFLTTSGGVGFHSSGSTRNIVRCVNTICDSISYRYFSADTVGSYDASSLNISGDQIEIKVNGLYVDSQPVTETVCDPTGKEYSLSKEHNRYFVDTSYLYKYSWKDNRFLETDYRETPAFEVMGFFKGPYTSEISYIISESLQPNRTIQQTLDAYFDFFDATADERNNPPTIPCNEVNKYPNWLPYSIPTTVYESKDQDYFAAVNSTCKLVVWKKNADLLDAKLIDLEVIGRESLVNCNPDFISFQWRDITGSDISELIITSGISKQTIWIYDVSPSVKLLHQATGFSRENPLVGVQLQKINNAIVLKVGLPRNKSQCLDAFDCFLLDKEFDTFVWNNEKQSFVPVP